MAYMIAIVLKTVIKMEMCFTSNSIPHRKWIVSACTDSCRGVGIVNTKLKTYLNNRVYHCSYCIIDFSGIKVLLSVSFGLV